MVLRTPRGGASVPSHGRYAGVVELADTPDLGSGAARFGGSSPPSRILSQLAEDYFQVAHCFRYIRFTPTEARKRQQ